MFLCLAAMIIAADIFIFLNLQTTQNLFIFAISQAVFISFIAIIFFFQKREIKHIRKTESENRELLQKRLDALEAAAEGIAIVDPDGVLTYMNSALMKLHGISGSDKAAYVGQHWDKLYVQKGADDVDQYVLDKLDRDGFWRGEVPVGRLDGDVVMLDLSFSKSADGWIISTARDVSALRQADQEKEDLEAQFYQAQKMEAIGRLAGGIAHDFNNILAAMNGYAEFLVEDLDSKTEQHGFAVKLLKAGKQAKDVVDQLLAFSRQKQSVKNAVNLKTPVEETLSLLSSSLPKTIDVKFNVDSDVLYIDGNDTQISQVLMNLCVNAADAMEGEKGFLQITLSEIEADKVQIPDFVHEKSPEENENPPITIEDLDYQTTMLTLSHLVSGQKYALLSVRDSGEGMSRTIMEHIFEPFFTTKDVNKGTGLGLATVHGVVVSHQGALVLQSTLGEGTTFDLYFPISGDAPDTAEGGFETQEKRSDNKHSATILLVEDEEHVRDMLLNAVRRIGYDAEACCDGLEGLQVIKENPQAFDLVITDHNMPNMSGLEMVAQAQIFAPNVPFIMLSGYSQEKLQEVMADMPAIKTGLRKPVSRKILEQKIDEVLKKAA